MNIKNNMGYHEIRKVFTFKFYYYYFNEKAFLKNRHIFSILKSYENLSNSDFSFKTENRSFVLDITKNQDEIFSNFNSTTRNILRNEKYKSRVKIYKAITEIEKNNFYDYFQKFLNEKNRRQKVLPLLKEELNNLEIFYAISDCNEYLGGVAYLKSEENKLLYYKYGATSHKYNENDFLTWEVIKYGNENGFYYFDTSPVTIVKDKNDPMYGYYHFKKKWGGQMTIFYNYYRFGFPLNFLNPIFKLIINEMIISKIVKALKKINLFK